MTQAITPIDPTVAALQESVRHNEKNIDKLDRDLKDFRAETLKQFDKINDRFEKVNDRFDQFETKLDDRITQLESKSDQRFEKVNDRFNQLETKVNDRFNQITMLLVAITGLIIALLVKLVVFD